RQVVKHENLVGVEVDKLDDGRQVAFVNQNVVHQTLSGKLPDSGVEIRAQNELVVGLGLNYVAQALQFFAEQCFKNFRKRGGKDGRPAHHSADELVACSHVEQPFRFAKRLASLHDDGSTDAARFQFRS